MKCINCCICNDELDSEKKECNKCLCNCLGSEFEYEDFDFDY
jgi:hypothetical protein